MTGKASFKTAAMGKCQSNFPFYEGQKLVIGREPVYTAEFLGAKPSGGFVLIQMQGVVYQGAHKAMHREMEHGIVSLDGSKEFIDTDFGVQLLSYLAPERLDWAFPGFYLASRKLPLIFKLSVFALGGKHFPVAYNDCRLIDAVLERVYLDVAIVEQRGQA